MARSVKQFPCWPQHAPHPKCRPGKTSHGTRPMQLRANGRWGKDNGNPGLAFVGIPRDATDAITGVVWVAHCDCKYHHKCPVSRGLTFAVDNGYVAVSVERRRQARGVKTDRVRRSPRRRRR